MIVFFFFFFLKKKLGLIDGEHEGDRELVSSLLDTMAHSSADFTNTFRFVFFFSLTLHAPVSNLIYLTDICLKFPSL